MKIKKRTIITIGCIAIIVPLIPILLELCVPTLQNNTIWQSIQTYIQGLTIPILTLLNIFVLLGVQNSVSQFMQDDKKYRKKLQRYNNPKNGLEDFKIKINPNATIEDNFNEIMKLYKDLKRAHNSLNESSISCSDDLVKLFKQLDIPIEKLDNLSPHDNPFEIRDWETHNLLIPNTESLIEMQLYQLKWNMYKILIQNEPKNKHYQIELEKAKQKLENVVKNSYYVD